MRVCLFENELRNTHALLPYTLCFGAMNSSAQVTMLGSHCVMTIFDTFSRRVRVQLNAGKHSLLYRDKEVFVRDLHSINDPVLF